MRQAIITGAGSGIGRAACQVFADAGARIVAVDVDADGVDESLAMCSGSGHTAVVGSVADPVLWERAVAAAPDLDTVYLNAGVYGFNGPIDQLPLDLYRRTVDANIDGVVLGVRAVVPVLRANGGGAIVVTASVAGIVAFEGNPVYTLTKQAVAGFVRAVAPSLAADGVTIDAVCPAVVATPMTSEAMGDRSAPLPETSALGTLIEPATIARTALALATSEGTGRCRAVRQGSDTVDWRFPDFRDLARAEPNPD